MIRALKKFLSMFKPSEGFNGFNLNLGCPSPQVIGIGLGCAMIKRVSKAKRLIQILKSEGYSVSIKMRLGLNKYERGKKTYLNLINEVDADFFIVHARDGSQTYADPSDFNVYEEGVNTGKTIIANGDIKTKEHIEFLKSVGVSGAMIGRAAIVDPTIFGKLKNKKKLPSLEEVKGEYINLSEKYGSPVMHSKRVLKFIGSDSSGIRSLIENNPE